MRTQSSDTQLIARVVSLKDDAAFAELVKRYQSAIRQFCRRLTAGDYFAADDIAQETFWLAYQKLANFKAQGSFSSWLHTIAYRQFLRQINSNVAESYDEELHDLAKAPQDAMDADIIAEKLMRCLSIEERVTITLSYSAGMSHGEISNITKLPLGTVKSHIKRGKQKLTLVIEQNPEVA